MKTGQASLLSGAKGRLLDFSIPFRFFLAAGSYHLLFWVYLLIAAPALSEYRGGPGPALVAIHLLTLGVFAMTAIGAALQLLSVATMRPFKALWSCRFLSWLMIPGVAVLAFGMLNLDYFFLVGGGTMLGLALIIFAALIVINLLGAPNIGVVTAYAWIAILCLSIIVLFGLALSVNYFYGLFPTHRQLAITHMILASYGFMGMLALGFSYILIPMFALSPAPNSKLSYLGFAACSIALLLVALNFFVNEKWLYLKAAWLGLAGCGIYLFSMQQSLVRRMRKRFDFSFKLIFLSWTLLIVSLLLAILLVLDLIRPVVFVSVLLAGWLLTFLLAVLQRIVPFLASMHSSKNQGKTLMVSQLTQQTALNVANMAHLVAVTLLIFGVCLKIPFIIQLACVSAIVGAAVFLYFLGFAVRRTLQVAV